MLSLLLAASAALARPAERRLSQEEAAARAARVGDVSYDLSVRVDPAEAEFSGRDVIAFGLSAPDDLTVDFDSGTIVRLLVNDKPADASRYNGVFLTLGRESLRRGENTVVIDYKRSYSSSGNGLYRFKDPEDGRVYVYTDFEPYSANKLFPCFDQPDLKAVFTLAVDAPAGWEVVSASPAKAAEERPPRKLWTFEPTAPMSPYVFSLHAGPYKVWTDNAGDIPLRLMARQSLAPYVDEKEWLLVTRQGLDFYQRYFAIPYPFKKYDQLLVPDYNWGAMENVGAVTFAETYVKRGKPTREERQELAETILHEMAHMWFGDLVTMRWWNGLWLNESFASYMEALSSHEATEFKDAWRSFFSGMKEWAYWEDQLVVTHPIETPVPDTEGAFANFDGITYGKGASVLKQLAHFLGEETFRDGVRDYLKSHAYGNAQESDFFSAMEKASGRDLKRWTEDWLHTTGVNSVHAQYACAKGAALDSLALIQEGPVLRQHRTMIGLYQEKEDDPVSVSYDGERTAVAGLAGKPCPALVFPNDGDFDYVKTVLDARSLEAAKRGPSHFHDPLLRAMLWHSLWQMVQDSKWRADEYAELVFKDLGRETDQKVAAAVLETVHGRHPLLHYLPEPDFPRWEAFFWDNLMKAAPGSDFQKMWFDAFVKTAESPAGLEKMRRALDGTLSLPGLTVDQDRRWAVIVELNASAAPGSADLVEAESRRDASDKGVKAAVMASAVRPEAEAKRRWLAKLTDPKASLGDLRPAMEGLFPRTQDNLRAEFAPAIYAALPALAARADEEYLKTFTENLLPATCSPDSAAALGDFLKKNPGLPATAVKNLKIARQEDERCVRIRALLKP